MRVRMFGRYKGECRDGLMEVVRESVGVVGWRLEDGVSDVGWSWVVCGDGVAVCG